MRSGGAAGSRRRRAGPAADRRCRSASAGGWRCGWTRAERAGDAACLPALGAAASCASCRAQPHRQSWAWRAIRGCSVWRCGGSLCATRARFRVIEADDSCCGRLPRVRGETTAFAGRTAKRPSRTRCLPALPVPSCWCCMSPASRVLSQNYEAPAGGVGTCASRGDRSNCARPSRRTGFRGHRPIGRSRIGSADHLTAQAAGGCLERARRSSRLAMAPFTTCRCLPGGV